MIDLFAAVKSCFDPEGILNPGVKVPLDGQRAIAEVKYDPALDSLPDVARPLLISFPTREPTQLRGCR